MNLRRLLTGLAALTLCHCTIDQRASALFEEAHFELRCGEPIAANGEPHVRLVASYRWQIALNEYRLRDAGRLHPDEICTTYRMIVTSPNPSAGLPIKRNFQE